VIDEAVNMYIVFPIWTMEIDHRTGRNVLKKRPRINGMRVGEILLELDKY